MALKNPIMKHELIANMCTINYLDSLYLKLMLIFFRCHFKCHYTCLLKVGGNVTTGTKIPSSILGVLYVENTGFSHFTSVS